MNIWFSIQVLLTTLAFLGFLFFLQRRTSYAYTKWDLETTTISDYTVLYHIPEDVFTDFRDNIYPVMLEQQRTRNRAMIQAMDSYEQDNNMRKDALQNESLIYLFKCYIKDEFEDILRNQKAVKNDDPSSIEISHVHLNFNNVTLMEYLAKRGSAIKSRDYDTKFKIENEIVEYIESNQEDLSIPKEAYIIFETEEAYQRAIKFSAFKTWGKEIATAEWKGNNFILHQVSEPTNIYFENKFKNMGVAFIKY